MGVVYSVYHLDSGRSFAAKIIKNDGDGTICSEYKICKLLMDRANQTPYITKIHDIARSEKYTYIIMEEAVNNLYELFMRSDRGYKGFCDMEQITTFMAETVC